MTKEKQSVRPRHRWARLLRGAVVTWLLLELLSMVIFRLRKPLPADDIARLYRPHPYRAYMLAPGAKSARGHVSINSHGFRGPEIDLKKRPGIVRIACFGGSTTFNDTATTDGHTWPAQMERFLRDHYAGRGGKIKGIEVINAGTPGYTSLESLIYLESKLLDYNLDIAIFHHGLNDAVFMADFRDFASDYVHARKVFYVPRPRWWEHSAVLSLLLPGHRTLGNPYRSNRREGLAQLTLTDPNRLKVDEAEQRRCFKPERINIFERNLRNFIYVSQGNGVQPVLSTMVCSPDAGFFAEVVGRINDRIRTVAKSFSIPCVDYAKKMPWSAEAFVDICHLRDGPKGLERKGKIFAEFLVRNGIIERTVAKHRGRE